MNKKAVFLFLGLILPVLIFLFLKFFGKNQFEVPLLNQQNQATPGECGVNYSFPYTLPDSVAGKLALTQSSFLLLDFSSQHEDIKQLIQYGKAVRILTKDEIKVADLTFFKKCILLMPASNDLVLIDDQKRIRGYYNASDRDELDRLVAELTILLKKY